MVRGKQVFGLAPKPPPEEEKKGKGNGIGLPLPDHLYLVPYSPLLLNSLLGGTRLFFRDLFPKKPCLSFQALN